MGDAGGLNDERAARTSRGAGKPPRRQGLEEEAKMTHWLLKSEPENWSWADQVDIQTSAWCGEDDADTLARMGEMALGDTAFFYHAGRQHRIMGIVEVVRGWHEGGENPAAGRVDVRAIEHLPHPVTLAEIEADPAFAEAALLREPQPTVVPVADELWQKICGLGGL